MNRRALFGFLGVAPLIGEAIAAPSAPPPEPVISLGALRRVAKSIPRERHETMTVVFHPNIESAVRDLPNFTPVAKYNVVPHREEIGRCELFRFVRSRNVPDEAWYIRFAGYEPYEPEAA